MIKKWIILDSVDSTNNYAAKWLIDNPTAENAVILAQEQYDGRGQMGTKWQGNPDEGLFMSLILKDVQLPLHQIFRITEWVSVSILQFLEGQFSLKNVKVKWPNDIFIDEKKVAGLLIETQSKGSNIQNIIIGVGLNVNQANFQELPHAVSLYQVLGVKQNVLQVAEQLLHTFNKQYKKWQRNKEIFSQEYAQCLLGAGVWRNYTIRNEKEEGCIQGVTSSGKLMIKFRNEESAHFSNKELAFLPSD